VNEHAPISDKDVANELYGGLREFSRRFSEEGPEGATNRSETAKIGIFQS